MESAATLSFYALLAMIPLFLLAVILLSRFLLASDEALTVVGAFSTRLMPELGEAVLGEVRALSGQRVWTSVSLFVLLGLIMPFASICRAALGRLVISRSPPTFLQTKLRDGLGTLTVLGLFLGAILVGLLRSRLVAWLGIVWDGSEPVLVAFAAPSLLFFGLVLFYAVFMPVRIRPAHLAAGALVATLLLRVFQPAFGAFLRFNPNYGFAFGSLKAFFVVIMWSYWGFCAILLGAEVVANVRRRDAVLLRNLLDPTGPGASSTLVRKFLRPFGPGEVIFREDEPGQVMYVIRAGEVVLLRSGRLLHTLGAGDFFGEMSMLLDAPRSATAEAGVNGAELIEIARENFDLILRENPNVVEALLRQMARRLHQANEWLIAQTAAPGSGENRLSNSARVSEEESVRAENQERERTP